MKSELLPAGIALPPRRAGYRLRLTGKVGAPAWTLLLSMQRAGEHRRLTLPFRADTSKAQTVANRCGCRKITRQTVR
jgi:hypothetical protein